MQIAQSFLKKRKKKAIPVLKAFGGWVETTNALPSSVLGKALSYAKKHKPYLMNSLLDGECQISNNLALSSFLENPQDFMEAA